MGVRQRATGNGQRTALRPQNPMSKIRFPPGNATIPLTLLTGEQGRRNSKAAALGSDGVGQQQ